MNLLNILNFINKIYEHELFPKILSGAVIILIVLFIVIYIIGLKDAQKLKNPRKEVEEDVKDITFNTVSETDTIKEDVTFEIPILTKNLEDFKKNIEEEIEKESQAKILQKAKTSQEDDKKVVKILDMNEIEDTNILPILPHKDEDQNIKETKSSDDTKKSKKSEK